MIPFLLFGCFALFAVGDVQFMQTSPVIVPLDGQFTLDCKSDSPWIWMDQLTTTNVTLSGRRIFVPKAAFVRYDDIVIDDPRVSIVNSLINGSKHLWSLTKINATETDDGYYSCIEQLFLPNVRTLTERSMQFIRVRVGSSAIEKV